jgi:hypothetical protein
MIAQEIPSFVMPPVHSLKENTAPVVYRAAQMLMYKAYPRRAAAKTDQRNDHIHISRMAHKAPAAKTYIVSLKPSPCGDDPVCCISQSGGYVNIVVRWNDMDPLM